MIFRKSMDFNVKQRGLAAINYEDNSKYNIVRHENGENLPLVFALVESFRKI